MNVCENCGSGMYYETSKYVATTISSVIIWRTTKRVQSNGKKLKHIVKYKWHKVMYNFLFYYFFPRSWCYYIQLCAVVCMVWCSLGEPSDAQHWKIHKSLFNTTSLLCLGSVCVCVSVCAIQYVQVSLYIKVENITVVAKSKSWYFGWRKACKSLWVVN